MPKVAGIEWKWASKWLTDEVVNTMESRMRTGCSYLRTEVVKSISASSRAGGPSQPGQPPHADTGHLRRTIFSDVKRSAGEIMGRVGTTAVYGAALELGATIRPKTKKALTIPLTKKAGRYPAPKFPAPLELVWPKSSRHGYLVERSGNQTTMHYLLTRGPVTLAARPYLRPGLNKNWATISKILKTGQR